MMKKLVVVLMAAFFSFSVAGLSFADEPKPAAAPAATGAPEQPCAGKEMPKKKAKKSKKKAAAAKKEEAPMAVPGPAMAPAEKK